MSSKKSLQKRRRDRMELKMYTDYYSNQLKNCRRLVSSASIGLGNGILGRYKPPARKAVQLQKRAAIQKPTKTPQQMRRKQKILMRLVRRRQMILRR